MMDKRLQSVVIVGSGNVAEALAEAVARSGADLVQVCARNASRAQAIAEAAGCGWAALPEGPAPADLYLIAVSDRAVGEVASRLAFPTGAVVAHTAGCVELGALPATILRRAVFYPLQTFTRGRRVGFSEIPVLLEASDAGTYARLEDFALRLTSRVIPASSALRARVHLAGVFANNFANHMYAVGERIVREAGLDFDVLRPLIAETAAKALDAPSPARVQTGPAVRGDRTTQERHEELLGDETLRIIYRTISQNIWETSKKI